MLSSRVLLAGWRVGRAGWLQCKPQAANCKLQLQLRPGLRLCLFRARR